MYFSNTGANPTSISAERGTFVSAWEKNNGTTNFTLKYGNGQSRRADAKLLGSIAQRL